MVNIDERARRSSDSPEPRPEHIPDSLTPEISEDTNQSLKHDRSEYPFCVLRRSPQSNEQEVPSDPDSFSEDYDSDGESPKFWRPPKVIDRSKGYYCRKGWVEARPANFGKGKEIFAEYKEKFKSLYEEMINNTLLVENLTLPGRVGFTNNAREEASKIVLEELKEEHSYEGDMNWDSRPLSYKPFVGFDLITEFRCGGRCHWVPPLDEEPSGEEQPRRKRPVMVH